MSSKGEKIRLRKKVICYAEFKHENYHKEKRNTNDFNALLFTPVMEL